MSLSRAQEDTAHCVIYLDLFGATPAFLRSQDPRRLFVVVVARRCYAGVGQPGDPHCSTATSLRLLNSQSKAEGTPTSSTTSNHRPATKSKRSTTQGSHCSFISTHLDHSEASKVVCYTGLRCLTEISLRAAWRCQEAGSGPTHSGLVLYATDDDYERHPVCFVASLVCGKAVGVGACPGSAAVGLTGKAPPQGPAASANATSQVHERKTCKEEAERSWASQKSYCKELQCKLSRSLRPAAV